MKSDISSTHGYREQWYLPCAGTDTDTRVCGGRGSRDRGVAVAKVIAAGVIWHVWACGRLGGRAVALHGSASVDYAARALMW